MCKKLTTEEFIEKAKEVHGDKYDYSKVEYVNSQVKVCIVCPEHGEFWQTPNSHLNGTGCKFCSTEKCHIKQKKSIEQFIKQAKEIHGDKYDYSKVEYKNNKIKVCIICPEHGEFWQAPSKHLQGCKCPRCSLGNFNINTTEFIKQAKEIHEDKYDYSKVEYKDIKTKVCIICPVHGEFWQAPSKHLQGQRCPKCYGNIKLTTEEFIKKAKEVHGDKYDYSRVEYKNCDTKVCIICPVHGEFWQAPSKHLQGCKCPRCAHTKKLTTEEFIEKAKEIHEDKYDYSKVEYVNSQVKVCIVCPEHGEFWQTPNNHLKGKGCPNCLNYKLEKEIETLLKDNKINFEKEKKFKWLKYKSNLRLDFYLPDYNVAIECQGIQHFEPTDFAGKGIEWAMKEYNLTKIRDKKKLELCSKNNIKLIYYNGDKNKLIKIMKKIILIKNYFN